MLTLATLGHTKRQNRFQIFGYALCEQYLYGQWFIPFNVSHKTWSEVFVRLCSLSNETEENCQFSPDETTVRMDGIITAYNVSVYTYDLGGSQCVHTCVCLWERDWAWGLWDIVMEDGTLPTGHCCLQWDVGTWWSRECGLMICCGCLPASLCDSRPFLGILGAGVLSSACAGMVGIWPGQLPVASGPLSLVPLAMGDKSVASIFLLRGWAHSFPWVVRS